MFSWDPRKARANLRKHGVSFEEGATIFGDAEALDWEDLEFSGTERRWKRIGFSAEGRILILIYAFRRLNDGTEIIRIISARCASKREREAYSR